MSLFFVDSPIIGLNSTQTNCVLFSLISMAGAPLGIEIQSTLLVASFPCFHHHGKESYWCLIFIWPFLLNTTFDNKSLFSYKIVQFLISLLALRRWCLLLERRITLSPLSWHNGDAWLAHTVIVYKLLWLCSLNEMLC